MAEEQEEKRKFLISFESGHYKTITGVLTGDSQWIHWIKEDDKGIHVNRDKVEYFEEY